MTVYMYFTSIPTHYETNATIHSKAILSNASVLKSPHNFWWGTYFFIRFEGRWEACSVFDAVEAPLGEEVFGGKPVLSAAEKDLTSKLSYPVLFKTLNSEQAAIVASSTGITNKVISDRLYNVEQIALASMGPNSIIDDAQKVLYPSVYDIAP